MVGSSTFVSLIHKDFLQNQRENEVLVTSIFIFHYISSLCVCVAMCQVVGVKISRHLSGAGSLFLLCGLLGSNSGCEGWAQAFFQSHLAVLQYPPFVYSVGVFILPFAHKFSIGSSHAWPVFHRQMCMSFDIGSKYLWKVSMVAHTYHPSICPMN